ncbi:MAG TPA: methyltransferase domain-containing protein [Verrucomicrobiae bacterium]
MSKLTLTPEQRQKLQAWLTEAGELYVDWYRPHSAGPSDHYFFDSVADLETHLAHEKWPELVVTIFRRLQFPIRGIADEALLARALQELPDHKELVIKNLAERYPSQCHCWAGSGNSHAELRNDFKDILGEHVGIGLDPEEIYEGIWDTRRAYWSAHEDIMILEKKRPPSLFERISNGFAQQPGVADPLIIEKLVMLLNLPPDSTILDICPSTDKYSLALADRAYEMIAVVGSHDFTSCETTPHKRVRIIHGEAGNLPLPTNSAAAAIIILASHRLHDYPAAFRDICRVIGRGPIIMLMFDHRHFEKYWLTDYFPDFGLPYSDTASLSQVIDEFKRLTQRNVTALDFPLPLDLLDKFGATRLTHPEDYLNPAILDSISDFAWKDEAKVAHGLKRLQDDLQSGQWDAKYGSLRTQPSYDVGYRFLVIN